MRKADQNRIGRDFQAAIFERCANEAGGLPGLAAATTARIEALFGGVLPRVPTRL
jgi:hypothetical protein